MKKNLLLLLFLGVTFVSFAQEKIEEIATDSYKRNSISLLVIDRGDSYDKQVFDAVKSIDMGDKFDKNAIATERITVKQPREIISALGAISAEVVKADLAKQIISCWYQRKEDGTMSDKLVLERGHYNADDQDYMHSQSSKIGSYELGDAGHTLLQGSYVLVLDYYKFVKGKDLFGDDDWTVSIAAHVYHLSYPKEILDQVYAAWITEEDDEEAIAKKNAAYDAIKIEMKGGVISAAGIGTATIESGGIPVAIANAYDDVLVKLEKKIETWQVTTPIFKVDTIRAKIGTKEGLKNKKRFQVLDNLYDEKTEKTSIVKEGYVRATLIADNRTISVGKSEVSEFYQISGGKLEEGMLLKQSNDLGMGLNVGYKVGGLGSFYVGIDYLASINTKGTSHYGLIDFSYDMLSEDKMEKNSVYSSLGGLSFVTMGLGYGIGFRPGPRFIEIMPYLTIGGDYMMFNEEALNEAVDDMIDDETESNESDDKFMNSMAWYTNIGARANITVYYPLQVFAGLDYTLIVSQGARYKSNNNVLKDGGIGRKNGVSFTIGAKYTF